MSRYYSHLLFESASFFITFQVHRILNLHTLLKAHLFMRSYLCIGFYYYACLSVVSFSLYFSLYSFSQCVGKRINQMNVKTISF